MDTACTWESDILANSSTHQAMSLETKVRDGRHREEFLLSCLIALFIGPSYGGPACYCHGICHGILLSRPLYLCHVWLRLVLYDTEILVQTSRETTWCIHVSTKMDRNVWRLWRLRALAVGRGEGFYDRKDDKQLRHLQFLVENDHLRGYVDWVVIPNVADQATGIRYLSFRALSWSLQSLLQCTVGRLRVVGHCDTRSIIYSEPWSVLSHSCKWSGRYNEHTQSNWMASIFCGKLKVWLRR